MDDGNDGVLHLWRGRGRDEDLRGDGEVFGEVAGEEGREEGRG